MFNLSKVDPIILDVAFIAILVLILFFGVIRSFRSVVINLIILTISIFLGFVKYTNDLKLTLIKLLKVEEWLPAGSTNTFKLGFGILSNFISSVLVAVIFFIVLKLLCVIVSMLLKRRNVNREKAAKRKAGRVFGGILNLLYGFVLLMVLLFAANNNLTGVGNFVERSTVTKQVVNFTETQINKVNKDVVDMVTLKVLVGDVLYDVDYEMIASYKYIDEQAQKMLDSETYVGNIVAEDWQTVAKDRIYDLYNMAVLANRFVVNNTSVQDKFVKTYEEIMSAIESVNATNQKVKFAADEHGKIKLAFSEKNLQLGAKNIARFEDISEIQ